ncbi:molybdopterin-dependent oxidoreductase [Thalassovita aquimarina]|uniref:Molybdopterin-dependent oxidoreductase n=1 Tax=Thalassovita aquimarina TaxID=2785917 RepID=A0ABS5HLA7_9RHOB|nr:molybdopterin-dependent oxidoreductase [Thalassovita aquimarina]MBR9649764.1 molybdopterin-dependent oxidoreductase [Thalassovita aquimarina]
MRILSAILTLGLASIGIGVGPAGALADNGAVASPASVQQQDSVLEVLYDDGSGRKPVQLTLDQLRELPRSGFRTTTVWTEGEQHFEGVWLKDLVAHLGVSGGNLELSALNEYRVEIPVDDIDTSEALIAYLRNGEPMSVRDKGPLWMVFPYDRHPKFKTETTFALSIWQLDRITLLK